MTINYEVVPIDEVIRADQREHGHFFDQGAVRFFNSRSSQYAYKQNGFYFWVSSEKFDSSTPRKYTIRFACCSCMSIHEIDGFQAHSSKRDADARLKWYLTHNDQPEIKKYHHWKMELQHVPCDGDVPEGE
jgi:hypothetical protein